MAFNREKTQRTAEKLAQKGRLEASIKEYKKILAKSGDDAAIHNTVGDLYRRANKNRDAISHWVKTSELFESKGFYVKAIAVQKKIQKLEPSSLQVRRKLGELYLQQGLTKEARDEFQSLIEHYLRQNDAASAINVYQRLIQVEPEEPSHRAKLADLYVKSGIPQKAVREYGHIAKMMADGGAPDQAMKILMRALEMDASDGEFVRRAVIALRDAGAPELAREFLDAAVTRNAEAESFRSLIPEPVEAAAEEPVAEEAGLETLPPEPEPEAADVEEEEVDDTWILDTDEGAAVDALEASESPGAGLESVGEQPESPEEVGLQVEVEEEEEEPSSLVMPPDDMSAEDRGSAFGEGESEIELDLEGDLGLEPPPLEAAEPGPPPGLELSGVEETEETEETEVDETEEAEAEETEQAEQERVELRLDELPIDELDLEAPAGVDALGDEATESAAPELDVVEFGEEVDAPPEPVSRPGEEPGIEFVARDTEPPLEPASGEVEPASDDEVEPASPEVEAVAADAVRSPDDEGGLRLDDFDFSDIEIDIPEEPSPSTRVEPPPEEVPRPSTQVQPPSEEWARPSTQVQPPSEEAPRPSTEVQPPAEEEARPSTEVQPPQEPQPAIEIEAPLESPPTSPPVEEPSIAAQDDGAALPTGSPVPAEPPPSVDPLQPSPERASAMAATGSAQSEDNGAPPTEPTVRVDDLLAEAEVFVKYGLHDKAVERLEKVLELDPSHLGAATQLVRLQLEREEHERVGPLVNELYREVTETGAMELWRELKEELAAVGYRFEGEAVVALPDGQSLSAAAGQGSTLDEGSAVDLMAMGSEIDSEIRQESAAVDQARSAIDWLDDSSEGSDGERLFEEEEELFDLGAALQEELGPEEGVPPAGPEEQSLEEIIEGFKKGVSENLSPEDSDTHYNLGIAYREMMLLDEAISEFQIAAKDQRYLVDCCAMLGLCFREKGLPDLALKWYRKGLESDSIDEEQTLGMMYEMGTAYLELEDPQSAYRTFVDIYGQNTNYRDVADRVQELGHSAS